MIGKTPRVLAVVLNWNGVPNTIQCVRHLREQSFNAVEILVVDNGSTDGSVDQLCDLLGPNDRLLALTNNRGFAGGMNAGLKEADERSFDYAWLVNNDAFAESNCLEELVRCMEASPKVMMGTPRLVGTDGREQHAGGKVDWFAGALTFLDSAELSEPARWGVWLTGTAPLLRLRSLREVGRFDTRFFAYWEDADLSMRVLRAGGDLRAVPSAQMTHLGGASSGHLSPIYNYLMVRNGWLFFFKHTAPADRLALLLSFFGRNLEKAGLSLRRNNKVASAIVAGLVDALRGKYGKPTELESSFLEWLLLRHFWRTNRILQTLAGYLTPVRNQKLAGGQIP